MPNTDPASLRVVVLAGGRSSEREISLESGAAIKKGLIDAGFASVDMIDPSDEGAIVALAQGGYDVAFIGLHGEGGEDGTIQGVLEWLGIPYTGSGVIASGTASDKVLAKLVYQRAGIPTSPDVVLTKGEPYSVDEIVEKVGTSCFVKPAINGSSFGVTPVHSADELDAAIATAFELDNKILIEKRIVGTEISVGVLGNKHPRPLPIVEINPGEGAEFYDLKVKYEPAELHHICPARLSPEDYARAQELAALAHDAIGCSGYSRSDFIVSEDGPVIIETNNLPGMTPTSLFPDEARHVGIEFADLVRTLVELALERAGK